jgi:hypothetical protein
MHPVPRDLPHDSRCGSAAKMFGAVVDVRRHDSVATATTRPACSPRSAGTRHRFSRNSTSLLSSLRPGLTTSGGYGKAATDRHYTSRRPDKPSAHRAPSVTAIACRRPAESPRDGMRSNHQSTGSAPGLRVSPKTRCAARSQASTQRTGCSIPGAPSSATSSLLETGKRTARTATRYGARRCRHRRVVPAGQRAHNEAASIHTCSDSGRMPFARAHGCKTAISAAERS